MKKLTKGQLLLTTLLSGVAFGFGAVNTIAQEAPVETVDAPAQVAEVDNSNDVVIVTGSRIRRRGIETIFPTTTVDETNLTDRGFTNIADALTEIPAFGNGFSDAGSAQGASPGQNFVDFLDLGTSRTLVLVDGKRFVNSATPVLGGASGLQVDFNIIPSALIDRTDVIGVGGAAIYGADAIAGTVNVILKDDFEGLEASSQYKVPEAGGAEKFQFQLVAGANFAEDKGNVTFSAQYETQEGMLQTARDSIYAPENNYTFFRLLREDDNGGEQRLITNNLLINIFTNGGLASGPFPDLFGFGTDFGTVIPSFGIGQFPNGGFLQFDANGELVTFNPGTSIPGVSIFFAQGGDGSNLFQETRSIQTPSERLVGTSRFNYEFNDHLKAKADFIFGNTKSTDQANQGGFASFAFSPTTDGALEFSIDHPLLTGQARQALLDSGIQPGGTFTLSRLMNDIVDSSNSVETSLWRFSGGLEGDFSIGERQFFWDVNFTHGETDLEQIATVINDGAFLNALNVTRVTQADIDAASAFGATGDGLLDINQLSGVPVGLGDVVCQAVLDAAAGVQTGVSGNGVTAANLPFISGCAPLDLFGLNRASPEAIAFVTGPSQTLVDTASQQFVANLSGSIIDLPAGPLGFNVGYERRLESGNFVPALADQIGLGRGTPSPSNGGSFRTEELYGELSVPLVSPDMNIPLVHFLQAEGAYRTIDVSTLDNNTEAFTVGGRYSPIEDITFVGNYTESTRLPSVAELFTPISGTFTFANDPCDNRNVGGAGDVALRTANCAADGIDATTFVSNVVNASVLGKTGGNPLLTPETSKAFTIGVILEPRFIPNFTAKIDYIDVEIDKAISQRTLTQIMNACYDSLDFANDKNCQLVTRASNGQVVDFRTDVANAGLFDTQFLQVQASYFYDVNDAYHYLGGLFGGSSSSSGADWGTLSHNISAFSPLKRDFAVGDEDPGLNNTRGGFNDPNVSINFATNYDKGNWHLFWGVLWQDNPLVTTDPLNTDEFFDVFVGDVSDLSTVPNLDANGRLDVADRIVHGDGSQFIHNASISYNLEDVIGNSDTVLQLSVSNVFDRQPSRLENALGDFNQTQILGRTYTFRVRTRF